MAAAAAKPFWLINQGGGRTRSINRPLALALLLLLCWSRPAGGWCIDRSQSQAAAAAAAPTPPRAMMKRLSACIVSCECVAAPVLLVDQDERAIKQEQSKGHSPPRSRSRLSELRSRRLSPKA